MKINFKEKLKHDFGSKKAGRWHMAVFLLNMLILSASVWASSYYGIGHLCQEEKCIAGQSINWTITLKNQGQIPQKIVGVEIIDSINESVMAELDYGYNPFNSDMQNYLSLLQGQEKTIYITSEIPYPNFGNEFTYNFCVSYALDPQDARYVDSYTSRHCYSESMSITVLECARDEHCKMQDVCKYNKCEQIECGDCQYAFNHECNNYECCESSVCDSDESCINHKCQRLNCPEKEGIFNQSCIKLNCNQDEYIFNNSCVNLNCNQDEYIFNNSCVNLNCSYDEYIFNQSCVKLNCNYNEYAINHSCTELVCQYNETAFNHDCVALNCGLFQKNENHSCIFDRQFVFKFALELAVILVIVFFLVLDVRKYESRHKDKKEEFKNRKDINRNNNAKKSNPVSKFNFISKFFRGGNNE